MQNKPRTSFSVMRTHLLGKKKKKTRFVNICQSKTFIQTGFFQCKVPEDTDSVQTESTSKRMMRF